MREFLASFSTRETAFIICISVGIGSFLLFKRDVRVAFWEAIKSIFEVKILTLLAVTVVYVGIIVYGLSRVHAWYPYLLKDTMVWFIMVHCVAIANLSDTKDKRFFRNLAKKALKLTIIIEFMINAYTFSLGWEMLLVPCLTGLYGLRWEARKNEETKVAAQCADFLLKFIILGLLGYACFEAYEYPSKIFTVKSLLTILLPPVFTILTLPFLYLIALFFHYEKQFITINYAFHNVGLRRRIKWHLLLIANISLEKVRNASQRLLITEPGNYPNIKSYVKSITQ